MQTTELRRLSRQCQAILDRLKQRPASNRELAVLSLKYTSRISDIRAAGWDVVVQSRDHRSGLTVYELRGRIVAEQLTLNGLDATVPSAG